MPLRWCLGSDVFRAGLGSLLLDTAKAEVGLAGRKSSKEEGKCRKMGVSDGFVPELVLLDTEADETWPQLGHGHAAQDCIQRCPGLPSSNSVPVKPQ